MSTENNQSKKDGPAETSALADGSGQLTPGAEHYGITTRAACSHLVEMLQCGDEWDALTGFDRACICEVVAYSEEHGLAPVGSNIKMSRGA